MNDKLQQLYDLYKQKGIISTTDFNTFAAANDAQRQKLYDLGVQKGLFNTTDYNTFNTAWGGGKQEPLKKKEPTVSESKSGKPTSVSSSTGAKPVVKQAQGAEILTGFPGNEEKKYKFKDGKWYEESGLKVYGQKEGQYTQITTPSRIQNLNRYYKKDASVSQEEQVYSNYDDKKKDNLYRINNGQWERQVPGGKFTPVNDESATNALNRRYGQNVVYKPLAQKPAEKPKDFNNITASLVGQTEESGIDFLTKNYSKYGFTFEQEGAFAIDQIRVKTRDGKKEEVFEFDEKNPEEAARLRRFLQENASKAYSSTYNDLEGRVRSGMDKISPQGISAEDYLRFTQQIKDKNIKSEDFINDFKMMPVDEQKDFITNVLQKSGLSGKALQEFYKSEAYADYKRKKSALDQSSMDKLNQYYDELKYAEASKNAAKIKEAKAKINAYFTDEVIQDNVKQYDMRANDLSNSIKTLESDSKAYKEKVAKFNALASSGGMTQQQFDAQKAALDDEAENLQTRAQRIQTERTQVINSQNKLNYVAGKYIAAKEKEGNIGGFALNKIMSGVSMTFIEPFANYASYKNRYEDLTPEERKYYQDKGLSQEQVENYLDNQAVLKGKEDAKKAVIQTLGTEGTTLEYMNSSDRGWFTQAIGGVLESLPAMATGVAGSAASFTGLAAQAYSGIEEEMLRDKDFQYTSAADRALIAIPYAAAMGVLENIGLSNMIKADSYAGKVLMGVALKSAEKVGGKVTREALERVAQKEVESLIAKGAIKITQAGLAEFETGATQALVLDQGLKELYNRINQSGLTEEEKKNLTQGEFFDTADSLGELASKTFEDGLAEMVGGHVMGTVGVVAERLINGNISLNNEDDIKFLQSVASDSEFKKLMVANLKTNMLKGTMTKSQAESQLNALNQVEAVVSSIPSGISDKAKTQAFNLILERNKLQQEIDKTDPALATAQKERVNEINLELDKISKDAVQEQSTDAIPVQPKTGVGEEVEGGTPETGLKEVTEKATQEIDNYIADIGSEERIGSTLNPLMDKMANAEYINDNDIDNAINSIFSEVERIESSDQFSPETKAAMSDKLLNIADKLDNYEFRTKTENVEVTKAGAASPTRKTSAAVQKIRAEKYFNAVQATVNGQEVTLQDENGRVEAPMPNGEVIVLDTPSMEIVEDGFEFDENDALVSVTVNDRLGNTVKLTGDQALDFAIRDRENKIGVVEQAEFDKAYQEVETRYVKEAKPAEAPVVEEVVAEEAPVEEPAVEEVVAEAPVVEETPVAQADAKTKQLNALLNVEVATDFSEVNPNTKKTNKVLDQVTNAAKAISKVLPKVKFVIHATPEAFVKATKELDGRESEGGIYDHNTKTIHINLKNANNRTVAHEVFHALILSKVASDAEASRLTRSMVKAVIKSLKSAKGSAEIIAFLEDFESDYDANIQNEEKLAELFGLLADNYKQLPLDTRNVIVRFLERIAKLFGLQPMTSAEVTEFMNVLSRKVEGGDVITTEEIGKQKDGAISETRKQIIGEKGAERLDAMESNTRRMSNLVMAKNMTDDGKSPLEIRVATGWELGADGKWRYETVDNIPYLKDTVKQVNEFLSENKDADSIEQKANFFLPPKLIEMYPELGDITIEFGRGDEKEGSYSHKNKRINVNIGVYPKNTVSTLLHEVQHAIQEIEGFDSGTNMDQIFKEFLDKEKSLSNRIKRLKSAGDNQILIDKARKDYGDFIENFAIDENGKKVLNAFNLYNRKSGEVEARNVEKRMEMTEEQRKNTLLSETAEVKKPTQIFDENKFAPRKQKGLINLTDQEAVKYARAGVDNKYEAQAIKQIGLQGTKFDKKSILDTIKKEFDRLVKNTKDYIFREDSPAIDQAIQNEIDTMVDQGYSNDQIERAKRALKPGPERNSVIDEYRRAQLETANQWESYLGQSDYTPAFKYLILDAVLTNNYDLKSDRYQKRTAKTIRNFTPFDAGTLATLYVSDSNELLKDYVKIQANNSANIVESAEFSSTKDGKWIKFDGGKNISSEQELQDNANKLSQLVQNTYWCTKTNALGQLRDGDFYVYVTENQQGDFDPRIAVRMRGDEVAEVRGNASSKQDLEADMLPVADKFLKEKIPNDSGKKWLDSIAYNTKVKELTDKIENKVLNMDDVMEYIDILKDKDKFSVDYGENGLVQTLQDKFKDAKFSFGTAKTYSDINDDTLLLIAPNTTFEFSSNGESKNVQVVIGNVNFYEDFDGGKIKLITGDVEIGSDSSVKEIKSIESIGGNLILKDSNIRNLGKLKKVGGTIDLEFSEVEDLGDLEFVGGNFIAEGKNTKLKSLGNLKKVGINLEISGNKNLKSLGKLELVGGSLDISFESPIEDLGNLTEIGKSFLAEDNKNLKSLGNLKKVGGLLKISGNKNLKSLGKLESVGYSSNIDGLNISETSITDLGNLEKIKGLAIFPNSDLKDLGNLKLIEGDVNFADTKIESLGKLKEIGRNAYFVNSNVKDLGDLESIGGGVWFNNKIKDLGKLKPVARGKASFDGNEELEKQYKERQQSQFAPRKQKNSVDRLVKEGKEQGKTDQEIKDDAKAAGFTFREASTALSNYYAKEEGVFVRSGKTGVTTKLYEGAKRWKERNLKSKGLLPKIGFFLKEKMEGEISKETNRAVKIARKFGKMFDNYKGDKDLLLDAFDRFLRGDTTVSLPNNFASIANEMRNHIDTLSKMLINVGAVEAELADVIRGNIGSYLTRSYEIYDNKNWRNNVGKETITKAKNFLRSQESMLEMAVDKATQENITLDEALDILVDNKIDDLFAQTEPSSLVSGSRLGSKDLSTLKEREEIPEEIRMLMGEYSDPAMNYARTVNSIIHLAARHKFLTDMRKAGLGKFFYEKNDLSRPVGFNSLISAEGSEVMAPLNGLYTTPEIVEAFNQEFGQKEISDALKVLYTAMGFVKWLKTIASVGTHAKNIVSNLGFVMVNGHNITKLYDAYKIIKEDLKTMSDAQIQAKIDEYVEAGIMRQGAGINEIRDMFKDTNLDKYLERRLSNKKSKGLLGKVKSGLINFKTKAEALYQAEDDMFKIAAYENELSRYANAYYNKKYENLTPQEKAEVSKIASENVKNTYPTYSRIPAGIKKLRRFPLFIGSFISFQAESYRTAYNTIALAKEELASDNKKIKMIGATRIAGATAYLTIKNALLTYYGMAFGTGLSGIIGALFNDDEEEKKEKDVRQFLPPWSKNSDIIFIENADGTIKYIDFSSSDPHGGINKALNAFFRGEDLTESFTNSFLGVVEQFTGPDITLDLALQLKNNTDKFGNKIYNTQAPFDEQAKTIIDYVYKTIEPGTFTSVRKLVNEEDKGNVVFGELTGAKVRKVDVIQQFGFKLNDLKKELDDIKSPYNSEYYKAVRMMDDPKVSKKDFDEQARKTEQAYATASALYDAKTKEIMNLLNSANKLGADYDALMQELLSRKVISQYNLFEMEQGRPAMIEEKQY